MTVKPDSTPCTPETHTITELVSEIVYLVRPDVVVNVQPDGVVIVFDSSHRYLAIGIGYDVPSESAVAGWDATSYEEILVQDNDIEERETYALVTSLGELREALGGMADLDVIADLRAGVQPGQLALPPGDTPKGRGNW